MGNPPGPKSLKAFSIVIAIYSRTFGLVA